MVPDDVLFKGGAGETVRRYLLRNCDVQTLLRLATSVFYAHGVKSDVLFFQRWAGGEAAAPGSCGSTTCGPASTSP